MAIQFNKILLGSLADDLLEGGDGIDIIIGHSGNDILKGRGGNDYLLGRGGDDTASYEDAGGGVTVDLGSGTANDDGEGGTDKLFDIESVIGSNHNDAISGHHERGKTKFLEGGDGNDNFSIPAGAEMVKGGTGNDYYYVGTIDSGGTEILDESGDDDSLDLDDSVSLSRLAQGTIGFGRDGTTLVVDIDQDGVVNLDNDLAVLNFFAVANEDNCDAGTGLIEDIAGYSGDNVRKLFCCPDPSPLRIELIGGVFEDTDGDGDCDGVGTILVGRTDGIPTMLRIENAVAEYDETSFRLISGVVYSAIGNVAEPLFQGNFEIPFNTATSTSFNETGNLANEFTLAGLDINFNSLKIESNRLELGSNFALPEGLGGFEIELPLNVNTTFYIDNDEAGLGGKIDFPDEKFRLFDFFDIKTSDATIEYIPVDTSIKIQGKLELEAPIFKSLDENFKLTLDLVGNNPIDGEENFIEIKEILSDPQVSIRGSITANNIDLPGKFEIPELSLSLIYTDNDNNDDDEVQGTAKVKFPFKTSTPIVGVGLGFHLPPPELELNYVSFELDDMNISLPYGIFWQRVAGSVNNMAESDPDPLEFGGGIGLSFGPEINISLPDFLGGDFEGSLIRLDVNGTVSSEKLAGDYTIKVINEKIFQAQGGGEYDWSKEIVKANTSVTMLDGLITGDNKFKADFANGLFSASGTGTLTIPDSILFIGARGEQISSSFQMLGTDDGNSSNDYVAAWGQIGPLTLGLQVFFDGDYEIINSASEIPATNSFDVGTGAEFLLLSADWDNATNDNIAVRVKDPNGNFIEEVDFAANGIAIVDELTNSIAKTVIVDNPAVGNWDLELIDETGLGEVRITGFRDSVAPTIEVTAPTVDVSGPDVNIQWNAFDSDSEAKIGLFYDDDNLDFDGILITDNLIEIDGVDSFFWNTQGVATGDYYIYAMIMDGNNAPVFSYSQGRVQVTEEADLEVTQIASADSIGFGENLIYTVTVTNNGTDDSEGIVLSETLPEEVTFVSATVTPSEQVENTLTFELGNLANGESTTIDITVSAPTTSTNITASALVTSNTFDPDASNDTDILVSTVEPVITIDDVTLTEGDSGTTNALFTVSLNAPNTETVTVNYATSDGTATGLEDYIPSLDILEFAPGETEKTISIEVIGDMVVEEDETFFINLSSAINASIADDQAIGTILNNEIFGTEGDDLLNGTGGDDVIQGRGGNDSIFGDTGNDTLTGGLDSDRFVFNSLSEGIDTITDFEEGSDQIDVSASGFGSDLIANAFLEDAQFVLGSTASDSNHRFIYSSSTGDLFFDPDGIGDNPQQLLVTLTNTPTLGANSIFVAT